MKGYLWANDVLLKDFGAHAEGVTERLKTASLAEAKRQGRPVRYLSSSAEDKEAIARAIATRDGITDGLVCVLKCVEPCWSFDVYRNRATQQLDLVARWRQCLFLYHRLNHNSVKLYDKAVTPVGSVLRAETTIQDAGDFRVYRPIEGEPDGPYAWRKMRGGIADLHRRAEVSRKATERYLDALASVDDDTTLGELLTRLAAPTRWHGRRVRALRPLSDDRRLLETISRGEFTVNGVRNRDLQAIFFPMPAPVPREARRRSAWVSRRLRLLRAHGLLRKVPGTHRYHVTKTGRRVLTATLTALRATVRQLTVAA